jgi:hypothetical protein
MLEIKTSSGAIRYLSENGYAVEQRSADQFAIDGAQVVNRLTLIEKARSHAAAAARRGRGAK